MKVVFMKSASGNVVRNQVIVNHDGAEYFQSYNTVIAVKNKTGEVLLDEDWNYSVTTSKYRNQFLGESTAETKSKIEKGEYTVTDLNSDEL